MSQLETNPIVRIIGYTQFFGVPQELSSEGALPEQDKGSNAARLIECAGRTCYDSYGRGRGSAEYHANILGVGHGSVLEHASISFFLSGLSRGLSHELVRHRVGVAISQRSTRYVDESESPWVWHPLLGLVEEEDTRRGLKQLQRTAREVYAYVAAEIEAKLVEQGTDKLSARKQARGAARGVLGNALETEMVWTANIRALRHFIEMRASPFADAEIRVLANRLLEKAVSIVPEYFGDYERAPSPDGIGFVVTTPYRKV